MPHAKDRLRTDLVAVIAERIMLMIWTAFHLFRLY
jgi:hypothetical protein